ncbi:hypothetical protein BCEN4_1510004 [Burkholderia cenocepacia]|nr:hypothetical protein BCEN4_1510004 [Burkholderia cenocepacia]
MGRQADCGVSLGGREAVHRRQVRRRGHRRLVTGRSTGRPAGLESMIENPGFASGFFLF